MASSSPDVCSVVWRPQELQECNVKKLQICEDKRESESDRDGGKAGEVDEGDVRRRRWGRKEWMQEEIYRLLFRRWKTLPGSWEPVYSKLWNIWLDMSTEAALRAQNQSGIPEDPQLSQWRHKLLLNPSAHASCYRQRIPKSHSWHKHYELWDTHSQVMPEGSVILWLLTPSKCSSGILT